MIHWFSSLYSEFLYGSWLYVVLSESCRCTLNVMDISKLTKSAKIGSQQNLDDTTYGIILKIRLLIQKNQNVHKAPKLFRNLSDFQL